jgi:hypothetical protein
MTLKATTQEEALKFITETNKGDLNELQKNVEEKLIKQFELIGFISRGLEPNAKNGWHATETAKRIYNSVYKEPNFINRLKGYYCHYILKF